MALIPVYIIQDTKASRGPQDGNSVDSGIVQSIFSGSQFSIIKPSIPLSEEADFEQRQIKWSLEDSLAKFPSSPVLIVKNTSVSAANSDLISQIILKVIGDPNLDLLYLCKWQDRCHLYTDREYFQNVNLVNTYSPHGFQAVLVTPKGRNVLLGTQMMKNGKALNWTADSLIKEISNGNIIAKTTSPNIINYDINTATKYKEYEKTTECVPVLSGQETNSKVDVAVLFSLIVIFVVLIAWALTRF